MDRLSLGLRSSGDDDFLANLAAHHASALGSTTSGMLHTKTTSNFFSSPPGSMHSSAGEEFGSEVITRARQALHAWNLEEALSSEEPVHQTAWSHASRSLLAHPPVGRSAEPSGLSPLNPAPVATDGYGPDELDEEGEEGAALSAWQQIRRRAQAGEPPPGTGSAQSEVCEAPWPLSQEGSQPARAAARNTITRQQIPEIIGNRGSPVKAGVQGCAQGRPVCGAAVAMPTPHKGEGRSPSKQQQKQARTAPPPPQRSPPVMHTQVLELEVGAPGTFPSRQQPRRGGGGGLFKLREQQSTSPVFSPAGVAPPHGHVAQGPNRPSPEGRGPNKQSPASAATSGRQGGGGRRALTPTVASARREETERLGDGRKVGLVTPAKQCGADLDGKLLNFRRLRGSSARVYFFGDPALPSGTKDEQCCREAEQTGGGEAGSIAEEAAAAMAAAEVRALRDALRAWQAVCAEADAKGRSAANWIEWRRYLQCWSAWRQVVLHAASERAQQGILLARKQEEVACRFHRLFVLSRAISLWFAATEEAAAERAQREREEMERRAYDEDMERVRQAFVAKSQVADRFAAVYLCHRAMRCWGRGVRAAMQEAAAAEERQTVRSRIEAAICTKLAAASATAAAVEEEDVMPQQQPKRRTTGAAGKSPSVIPAAGMPRGVPRKRASTRQAPADRPSRRSPPAAVKSGTVSKFAVTLPNKAGAVHTQEQRQTLPGSTIAKREARATKELLVAGGMLQGAVDFSAPTVDVSERHFAADKETPAEFNEDKPQVEVSLSSCLPPFSVNLC